MRRKRMGLLFLAERLYTAVLCCGQNFAVVVIQEGDTVLNRFDDDRIVEVRRIGFTRKNGLGPRIYLISNVGTGSGVVRRAPRAPQR